MKDFFVITLFSRFFVKKSSYGFYPPTHTYILCYDICRDAIYCAAEDKGV